jgi:alpha-amylase
MMSRPGLAAALLLAVLVVASLPGAGLATAATPSPAAISIRGAQAITNATPSPADWRDIPIYQIFTDRFWDGDPSNNNAEGSYDPGSTTGTWDAGKVHGGDFVGVLEKLDYIQAMGFKAIWISPVYLNANGEYHGYAARDFKAIAPHFGTETELQALSAELHARGMYLILDVVVNHMGNMSTSYTSGYPTFHDNPSPYVLQWRGITQPAAPFNNLAWFHNNGEIQDYVDPDQVLGELFGLDDLKTEDPQVAAALVNASNWLIDICDADGFRIDTVKHVEMAFWQTWTPAVRAHADSIGKSNFIFFGEVFDGSDSKTGSYTGTEAGGAFALNSMLYYPMHFTMRDVFASGQPTSSLTARYSHLTDYDPVAREQLVYFLDNHDVSRFLSSGVGDQDWSKLRTALDFMLTTRGVPCVYQGTEQGFDGGSDPYDREDMWDGEWDYGPSLGDNFNMTHPLYRWMRDLLDIRSRYDAARTGGFTMLADASSAGIYAFLRTGTAEDLLVVVNSASSSKSTGPLATNWANGTTLADLRDPAFTVAVGSGGSVSLTLAGRTGRILVRAAAVTDATPAVDTQSPAHADTVGAPRPPIRLGFNRPMNTTSVQSAFSLSPAVAGTFSWEADTAMTFTPSVDLPEGVHYTVRVEATALAASGGALLVGESGSALAARAVSAGALPRVASDGAPMRAAFETYFVTGGGVPGLVVATGFNASIFVDGSVLDTPEGIAVGEGGAWGDDFFVGDAGTNRILRITPAGVVSTVVTNALLAKPEGLDFDRGGVYGGDLLVADMNGLLRVTAGGSVIQIAAGTSSTNTGALYCAGAGPFGGFPYLGSNSSNRVERYEAGVGYVPFASPVNGFEGVALGAAAFGGGEKLLVANPDLSSYASSIDGDGSILFADSLGVLSLFVQNASLLGGVTAMVVDTGGGFGGDLLAADVATESVLRVSPGGSVSLLASGFGNLFSSDCLTIGADGALYVVDTGSGEPFTDSSGGNAPARIIRIAADNQVGVNDPLRPLSPMLRVYPNPMAGAGRVSLRLEQEAEVKLEMFDVRGRLVAVPFAGRLDAGTADLPLDLRAGSAPAAGVYFLRVVMDGAATATARVVLW